MLSFSFSFLVHRPWGQKDFSFPIQIDSDTVSDVLPDRTQESFHTHPAHTFLLPIIFPIILLLLTIEIRSLLLRSRLSEHRISDADIPWQGRMIGLQLRSMDGLTLAWTKELCVLQESSVPEFRGSEMTGEIVWFRCAQDFSVRE